ncbi:hypothetical protein [Mycobacterium asiaticum]|nr:hypothetical protein [Mycobacterium asiaticum]
MLYERSDLGNFGFYRFGRVLDTRDFSVSFVSYASQLLTKVFDAIPGS